ncbi:MAG TPA: LysM peptidoglycan-binding domain-containing protein, partial [Steroidobacteraceae bacterium]|nr:LysM peptidoglycan-binding domain-containing protein [Steroidobacteraceae bacterium]
PLYGIAQRLGTDVHTLAQLNGLNPGDPLRAGQRLRVGAAETLAADRGMRNPSAHVSADTATAVASASTGSDAAAAAARRVTYTVRPGDTLYSIARLLQVTVIDLVSWNSVAPRHNLKPGQTLIAFVRSRG